MFFGRKWLNVARFFFFFLVRCWSFRFLLLSIRCQEMAIFSVFKMSRRTIVELRRLKSSMFKLNAISVVYVQENRFLYGFNWIHVLCPSTFTLISFSSFRVREHRVRRVYMLSIYLCFSWYGSTHRMSNQQSRLCQCSAYEVALAFFMFYLDDLEHFLFNKGKIYSNIGIAHLRQIRFSASSICWERRQGLRVNQTEYMKVIKSEYFSVWYCR